MKIKEDEHHLNIGTKAIQFLESVKGINRTEKECAKVWRKMTMEIRIRTIDAFNSLYPLFEPNPNN